MPRHTDAIDLIVAQNLKLQRLAKRMSQEELGALLGVTFQQIQKYEKAANRIGAGRLFRIASVLGVDIRVFFEGASSRRTAEHSSPLSLISDPRSFRLVQAFAKLRVEGVKRSIVSLVEGIAERDRKGH